MQKSKVITEEIISQHFTIVPGLIKRINHAKQLDEVLHFIEEHLKQFVFFDICSLALIDEAQQTFSIYPIKESPSDVISHECKYHEVSFNKTFLSEVCLTPQEKIIVFDQLPSKKYDQMLFNQGIRCILVVPLEVEEKILGALFVGSAMENYYCNEHISVIKSINEIIALSLDKFFFIQKLRQSKEEYQALFEYISDSVIIIDNTNSPVLINRNFNLLTGYTQEYLKTCSSFLDIFTPESRNTVKSYCEAFRISSTNDIIPNKCVVELITKQNTRINVELSFGIIPETGKLIISLRDITKRIKIAKDLEKRNTYLKTLYELSSQLQSNIDLPERLTIGIKTFKKLGFDRVRIYLRDKQENVLNGAMSSYISTSEFSKVKIPIIPSFEKAYHCATKKTPIIVNEETATELNKYLGKTQIKQSASLPLISKGTMIGMISLDNKYSKELITKSQITALMTFAHQLGVSIENANLYQQNIQRLNRLSAMYAVTKKAVETMDIDAVLQEITKEIVSLFHIDYCSILLYDDYSRRLLARSTYNLDKEYCETVGYKVGDGVSGKAYQEKQIVYVRNVQEEPLYTIKEYAQRLNLFSMLSVPLIIGESAIGVVNVYTKKERRYTPNELQFLSMLSQQAAIMIKNSDLYSHIKTDKENFSALLEISQLISSTLELDSLLSIILDKTIELTKADSASLLLLDNDYLKVKLCKGFDQYYKDTFTLKKTEGIAGIVVKTGEPIIVRNVSQHPNYISIHTATVSEATIPLIQDNKVIGILDLESQHYDNFSKYKNALQILTNQISVALEKSKLYGEISTFNKKLRNEIYQATGELRKKNEELTKMDKLKSDFVSNVSHELRTPLTSIKGYSLLMKTEKLGSITKEQQESLGIVCEEADRLTRLINDILDLSRLENRKMELRKTPLHLAAIAEDVITTMRMLGEEKNITITLNSHEKLPLIMGSKDLIKQVFVNLLGNAIKFTPEGGNIIITLLKNNNLLEISIKDTGQGIPPEYHDKLFDKFFQVDSSMTRQHGGTGLGLPISKHIVEQHGGTIWVISEVGKGSEFKFTLPIMTVDDEGYA
ncbi:GAF domain-containing protein [Candidatus Woesearchaeota archaeon]|nr:GAF domain-containing protein [Candidatus Woesearchaeota archaeon]